MAWTIRFTKKADKAFGRLDRSTAKRVADALEDIARLDDPRSRGKALAGPLAGLWRYRVGNHRVVCDIEDDVLVVLVVDVDHRSGVYRRR